MEKTKNFSLLRPRFGKYGWFLIVFSIVLYALACGINVTGLNLTVNHFVEKGWNYEQLLSYSTYGGYFGIIAAVFFGWMMDKTGMKWFFAITLVAGAIGCVLWGFAQTPVMYFIGVAIVSATTNGFSAMGTSNLMAIYFPRKKSIALGWTTMGINISDVIYLPILSALIAVVGVANSYLILGIVFVAMAVISLLFVKNRPEDKGLSPDNEPITAAELEELRVIADKEKNTFTFGDVIRQKQTWIVGVCFGMFKICCSGILSQLLVYFATQGVPEAEGVLVFSIAAVVGCFGSYLWGLVDAKIGPKKAANLLAIWFAIAVLLVVLPFSKVTCYLALCMFTFAAGGESNINASLNATQFGRFGFAKAFGIINPVVQVFRVSAFVVLSWGLTLFGGAYNKAYILFLVCAIIAVVLTFFFDESPIQPRSALKANKDK